MKSLLILTVIMLAAPLRAQTPGDSTITAATQSAPQLLKWFRNLIQEYDNFVNEEEKKQFLRHLSRLNESMYKLERRKEEFTEELKLKSSSYTQAELAVEMRDSLDDLAAQYSRFRKSADAIISAINEQQGDALVANKLHKASVAKGARIQYFQRKLKAGFDPAIAKELSNISSEAMREARENLSAMIHDLRAKNVQAADKTSHE